ncbi:MAG: hypothetical protein WCA20_35310 [Candidatus Sulfotelmatobacter sp.]
MRFLELALMTLVSSVVIAKLYVWPWLLTMKRDSALVTLVAPHMFLRFIGLSFLVHGVVSPLLPRAFAVPAAYGDFVAGVLAIIATLALSRRASWAITAVWVFNVWGTADLLFAFYQGPRLPIHPGDLGAAFFIPTAIVPLLLVAHALIFLLLVRPNSWNSAAESAISSRQAKP